MKDVFVCFLLYLPRHLFFFPYFILFNYFKTLPFLSFLKKYIKKLAFYSFFFHNCLRNFIFLSFTSLRSLPFFLFHRQLNMIFFLFITTVRHFLSFPSLQDVSARTETHQWSGIVFFVPISHQDER